MLIDPAGETWPAICATLGKPIELPSGEKIVGVPRRNGQLQVHSEDWDVTVLPGTILTLDGKMYRITHITAASPANPFVRLSLVAVWTNSP